MSGYEGEDEYAGRHGQLQRGSVFDPSRKFGTTNESFKRIVQPAGGMPSFPHLTAYNELSRLGQPTGGVYETHPPKEPLDPDEVAAHLQSIGF